MINVISHFGVVIIMSASNYFAEDWRDFIGRDSFNRQTDGYLDSELTFDRLVDREKCREKLKSTQVYNLIYNPQLRQLHENIVLKHFPAGDLRSIFHMPCLRRFRSEILEKREKLDRKSSAIDPLRRFNGLHLS
jgi:hypothetical protein